MLVSEALLRALIREELGRLDEAVRENYGYVVRTQEDVTWTPDKRMIPKERNPFVGSSPAYHSWYNDGTQSIRWSKEIERPNADPYLLRGSTAIYFNEGDYVIIPTIGAELPGRIGTIYHKDPVVLGVPGAVPGDTIPMATIIWSEFRGTGPSTDVGLAFLVKIGSKDPLGAATSAMTFYRKGRDEQAEKAELRAGREARREEKMKAAAPPQPLVTTPAAPTASPLRRPGGVAPPMQPRIAKPIAMSGDEVRDMFGLKRREE
jgi:hypothetical protein